MSGSERFRWLVAARAGGACEYCRLIEIATGMTFHIEHILPRSQGGQTRLANLALSCPGCNMAKGERNSGEDRKGRVHPLFNPRHYEPPHLGWHLNFELDQRTGIILPRTEAGEATISVLQMNGATRLFARRLQIHAGLIR